MGTMLEKITLYDILGYLLPEYFLETLVCLEYIVSASKHDIVTDHPDLDIL